MSAMSTAVCTYCHAPDNGTCAYPSENKPGCLLSAHRKRMSELPESLRDPFKVLERGRKLLADWGPTPITDAALSKTLRIIQAAKRADWQQVVANGGPPCFHLEQDGRFCLRAQRWPGHEPRAPSMNPEIHTFVPLDQLIFQVTYD